MKEQASGYYERRRRRFSVVLLIALGVAGFSLYGQLTTQTNQPEVEEGSTLAVRTQGDSLEPAIEALGKLAVRERAERTGYSRAQFGSGWAQYNGCDMRNLILQRDLEDIKHEPHNSCVVVSGTLINDPYTGRTINFIRGPDTSSTVQIDHIVALSDAWQKGAKDLDENARQAFANDPLNLLAVDGPTNMKKGDKDANDWLPHKPYRCRYVARQIAVKLKHAIWVTRSEYNAIKATLNTCPGQFLPLENTGNN